MEVGEVKYDIPQERTDEGGEIVVQFIRPFIASGIKDRAGGSSRFGMTLMAGKGKGIQKKRSLAAYIFSAEVSNMCSYFLQIPPCADPTPKTEETEGGSTYFRFC